MVYESRIDFTLDTICPWTYLAKRRLDRALTIFHSRNDNGDNSSAVSFTLHYSPYMLFPDFSTTGVEKRAWYLRERYNNSPEQMGKYEAVMRELGEPDGIHFDFGGDMAGTLEAHRVLQVFQSRKGPDTAGKIIEGLYRMYFEEGKHPSADDTLVKACVEAGIEESDAKNVVEDKECGKDEVLEMVRDRRRDGVDSVPLIIVEGKRRDFTLEGAKSTEEYVKVLDQVVKESR